MDLMQLAGRTVRVTFVEPVDANGHRVASITGEFGGGVYPGPCALNDAREAKNEKGQDITEIARLKGAAMMFDTRNIQFIVASSS